MVLIGYDGSPSAKRAISAAHSILGHRLAAVLHVWEPPGAFIEPDWFAGVGPTSGPPVVQLERLALERAERIAEQGAELARSVGFTAERRTEGTVGSVWRTIIDVARDVDAELIVVGARGLSTVRSALLGSVSNAVVHHSDIPVLVVPPPDATHNSRGAP